MGMTALLKHLLVDTEWERLIHVSAEGSHKAFIRQRVSAMKSDGLGHLGGFGVAVLEIKDLNPLLSRVWESVRKCLVSRSLIRKDLKIMAWTGEKDVAHFGEDYPFRLLFFRGGGLAGSALAGRGGSGSGGTGLDRGMFGILLATSGANCQFILVNITFYGNNI
jgi:hypothetical protein